MIIIIISNIGNEIYQSNFNFNLLNSPIFKLSWYINVNIATKQDAFLSIMILSKTKAEIDHESQLRVLRGQNKTISENFEISHLMKKSKSFSFKNLSIYRDGKNSAKINISKNNTKVKLVDHSPEVAHIQK